MGIESDARGVQEVDEIDLPKVRKIIEVFVDELADRLPSQKVEQVLIGEYDDLTSADLGQKPEAFTEQYLIYPLLSELELKYRDQPYGQSGDRTVWPDSEINNLGRNIANEHKSLNNVEEGLHEITVYLDSLTVGADYGLVTDGIEWIVKAAERSGDVTEFPKVTDFNLRPALVEVARERGHIRNASLSETDVDEELDEFVEQFGRRAFDEFITVDAPQLLRDARKRSVEEFYELYLELLFGKSDEYDYDTCLLNNIHAPSTATEADRRRFVVTLVNRLLFIKVLEEKGIVPENLLIERVEAYEENSQQIVSSLYRSQLEPLFYDLLNTPKDDRSPQLRTGWFDDIPYLNGGLFRPSVDREEDYNISDDILVDVIRKLIEGSELQQQNNGGNGGIDPAVLGSVFEKTINFMGGEYGTQKDIGAYYTPADVTRHIARETVDPKIKDIIVDAYAHIYGDELVRERMQEYTLPELLRRIEQGDGWFGDPVSAEEAYDRLGELTVVDPACGSGHFLTNVMGRIHRARRSLYRCKNPDDGTDVRMEYESRKELALNCIYGVDVDPVAVEIARLRVWLKIVEDGRKEDFGQLPNIELNIVPGNSLVGLPVKQEGQTQATMWNDRIDDLISLRREYKSEDHDTDKKEVLELRDDLREEFNQEYLKRLNHTAETTVESVEEWRQVVDSIDAVSLNPTIESVKASRADDDELTDADQDRLKELGFRTHKYSARLDIGDREEELRPERGTRSKADIAEEIATGLESLLMNDFVFDEVVRKPLPTDLKEMKGQPFHWVAEFPEVAESDGNGHDMSFDIIVGNPPYGDLLNSEEEALMKSYVSHSIPEIAAPFVERQLQLLDDSGWFGNVTTLALIYKSDIEEFHDLLCRQLDDARVASFGTRPSRVFENADIKTAIITGRGDKAGEGVLATSDLLMFTTDQRGDVFDGIEYSTTDGFILRDRIGGSEGNRAVLPKIGGEEKKGILEALKEQSDTTFEDVYERKPDDPGSMHPVYRREGVRYYVNPMREKLYDAREVKPMYFDSELERDFGFLVLSSSLFYAYWSTYGNSHHLNWTQISAFPFPDEDILKTNENRIHDLSDELWEGMVECFDADAGVSGEFHTSRLKHLIDDIDELLGEIYNLSEEEVSYLQSYKTDLGEGSGGRAGTPDEDITSYAVSDD